MSDLTIAPALPSMPAVAIDFARQAESALMQAPQLEVITHHVFHAGMYARTVTMPADTLMTGALIKRATLLIVDGDASIYVGTEAPLRATGHCVLPAGAGRKQVFLAHTETHITMVFPTAARSVEAAESEFTDETDLLMSRQSDADIVWITED